MEGPQQPTIIKSSMIVGMKNYNEVKSERMRQLPESHNDVLRMKEFLRV